MAHGGAFDGGMVGWCWCWSEQPCRVVATEKACDGYVFSSLFSESRSPPTCLGVGSLSSLDKSFFGL